MTPWKGGQVPYGLRRSRHEEEEHGPSLPAHLPSHIYSALQERSEQLDGKGTDRKEEDLGYSFFQRLTTESKQSHMPVRRLMELVDEYEIVWENGQNNPRAGNNRKKPEDGVEEVDRGRFPFIDEQAGLLDELNLKEILRLNYKTKSRHHPKWREIRYDSKKGHTQYLRRKEMNRDEEKAKMGIMRKALQDA